MVKNFIKSGANLINGRQTSILSAALVLMIAVLGSRVLGLIRDRTLASAFFGGGSEWQLDVYFAAFRLPDMLFQLLVLGALSAAFIPVYSSFMHKDKEEAWKIVNGVINLSCLGFFIFASLIFVFAYPLCNLIAPNFSGQQIDLMVNLTRIMLLPQFFFIISNYFTGVLQSNQRFLVPAIAPIFYNLGIILGIELLSPRIGIYGPTIGVGIGLVFQFLIQWPLIKKLGYRYQPILGINIKGVRKIGKLMLPRTLGLAVDQIELTLAVILGTAMSTGSLSIFYFAQHLQAVPVGLFGLTIGQAALPILSKEIETEEDSKQFKNLFTSSFKQILYLVLPASVLLLVLRVPLVRIAIGVKNFPWEATILTGQVVAAFTVSIVAQAVIQLLVRAFYALQDTKTPLYVGGAAVFINVILSLWFVKVLNLDVVGLALAISVSSFIQAIILFFLLNKKIGNLALATINISLFKMVLASLLMGISLWTPMRLLDQFILDTTRTIQLIILILVASGIGFMVYLSFSKILQIEELDQFLGILKKFGSWRKILSQSDEVLSETPSLPPTTRVED
jgi:putative peptidoglycan lipid II flippase